MTHGESPRTYRENADKLAVALPEMLSKNLNFFLKKNQVKMGWRGLPGKKTRTGQEHVREAMLDTLYLWK